MLFRFSFNFLEQNLNPFRSSQYTLNMHSYYLKSKIKIKSSECIPIEIQEDILKRLPVKPLLRFRSVSKPWKRLIDSPDFMVSYGVRHPQPDRFILGCKINDYEKKYFTYFDDDHSFVEQRFGSEDQGIPHLLERYKGDPFVVGSSQGLLCLKIIYHELMHDSRSEVSLEMVVVWNPSIRKSVCIPVPHIYIDLPHDEGYGVISATGFGVCPVTFDPIILKMKWLSRHGNNSISCPWRVRVFTLSTGTWNILSTNLPRESIRLKGSQVVIDRFIYWVAFETFYAEYGRAPLLHFQIMSFDLTAKEFKEINLPDSLRNPLCSIETISKLRESLVLLEYHKEEDISVCSLWMMTKEQGVNRSFSKLYNINVPDTKVKTLLGFRKTGELILETHEKHYDSKLEIYDPNSEAIVYNHGICASEYSFFMCYYMESLLLLDQLDGFIYSIGN